MNTNKQKTQRRETAQKQGTKKQSQKPRMLQNQKFHEQERIETRMTD